MTRLLISSICRQGPPTERSGFLYTFDLEQEQVLKRSEIIESSFREADGYPHIARRGWRGISVRPDQIAIANASVVFRYDPHWKLLGVISNPSMANIRDIQFQDDTLWITSACNDLLFQYDLTGVLLRHFYVREHSPATRQLDWEPALLLQSNTIRSGKIEFRDPRTHDEQTYDHAHVNSLCILPDGAILVSLGLVREARSKTEMKVKSRLARAGMWPGLVRANHKVRSTLRMKKKTPGGSRGQARSAVIEICADGSHSLVLVLEDVSAPSHTLLSLQDETVIYLNTSGGEVVRFQPKEAEILSTTKVSDGFLRGAAQLPSGRLVLGSQSDLLVFDVDSLQVVKSIRLTEDSHEYIHNIKVLPEVYDNPPDSFEENFQQANGFRGDELHQRNYVLTTTDHVTIAEESRAAAPPQPKEVQPDQP